MSLVKNLRDRAILSAAVVTVLATARNEISLYMGVAWVYGGENGRPIRKYPRVSTHSLPPRPLTPHTCPAYLGGRRDKEDGGKPNVGKKAWTELDRPRTRTRTRGRARKRWGGGRWGLMTMTRGCDGGGIGSGTMAELAPHVAIEAALLLLLLLLPVFVWVGRVCGLV